MRNLVEALPVATVLVDDDDRIVGWNRAATALYGWPSHETVTMSITTLMEDADIDRWREVRASARDEGLWRGNFRVRRRDGIALVSSFIAVPVVTDEDATMAWVATDVTDQAMAEEARGAVVTVERVAREEFEATLGVLEALLESLPLGLATFDRDLLCTRTNGTFDRLAGVVGDPVGRHVDDLALPAEAVGLLRRVATTGRSVLGRSVEVHLPDDVRFITTSAFPIFTDDRVSGVGVALVDDTAVRTAESERRLLERRADDAQHRLAVLAAASSILATSTDLHSLIERLARTLAPSAADWCAIELVDDGGTIEHAAVAHRDPELARRLSQPLVGQEASAGEGSVIGEVLSSGRAITLRGDDLPVALGATARDDAQAELYRSLGITSLIAVPIRLGSETMGVLCLSNGDRAPLNDDDLDLAIEVAHRAALAVGKAIAYRNEHVLAQELQQALLPSELPDLDQLAIDVRYLAASDNATVGGDWYDAFELGHSKVCLCIGDVFGHDTRAAVGMGQVRTLVHAFTVEESAAAADGWPDLVAALRRTEALIAGDPTAWGSCIVAVLDLGSGELRWINAGHPPPLLIRADGAAVLTDGDGAVLGLNSPKPRNAGRHLLSPGDRILLYTDGLVERRTENFDIGLSRLLAAGTDALDLGDEPGSSFADHVLDAMTAGQGRSDDIAILTARILSPPSPGDGASDGLSPAGGG